MPFRVSGSLRRVAAICLCLLFLIGFSLSASAAQPNAGSNSQPGSSKLDAEFLAVLEDADPEEVFTVWIFMDLIDHAYLNALLLEETGYDAAVYENEVRFRDTIQASIEMEVQEKLHLSPEDIPGLGKDHEYWRARSVALSDAANAYLAAKRAIVCREYSALTDAFLRDYIPGERAVIYQGTYTSTVIAEASRAEIETISRLPYVQRVAPYVQSEWGNLMDDATSQIGVYCPYGTGVYSDDYYFSDGYDGLGVSVGVVEYNGRYDANAPMLQMNSRVFYAQNYALDGNPIDAPVSDHATVVTSIIGGLETTVNGRTFKGIVPAATIHQVAFQTDYDLLDAIRLLIARNVTVANLSAGHLSSDGSYEDIDNEIDRLITETNIVLIVATGNAGEETTPYVSSPAKSLNVIAVGNAETKGDTGGLELPPYKTKDSSCYMEDSFLPNKPDICAPGSYIDCPYRYGVNNTVITGTFSGTSLSAPMVTGVVAQMLQAEPDLRWHPTMVKALLVLGADYTKMAAVNNPETGFMQRDKSGVGFLNAIRSVDNARFTAHTEMATGGQALYQVYTVNLYEGQKIDAALVFDKWNHIQISGQIDTDNLDLWLIDSANGYTTSSQSTRNNIERLSYVASEDTTVTLIVVRPNYADFTLTPYFTVAYNIDWN